MATNFNIEITSPEGATFNTENKHVGGKIFAVPKLQAKDVAPSASAQLVAPDEGYAGLSAVNVAAIPSDYVIPSGTLQITANGAKDVTNYKNVNVNVEPNLEEKTVTVTTNGTTEVTPTSGKDGISKVTINTNVPTASAVEEVATASAMDALLVEANVGKYYKYTGTTDSNYTNGDLYLVEGGAVSSHNLTWNTSKGYSISVNSTTIFENEQGITTEQPYQFSAGDVIVIDNDTSVGTITINGVDYTTSQTITLSEQDIVVTGSFPGSNRFAITINTK